MVLRTLSQLPFTDQVKAQAAGDALLVIVVEKYIE